MWACKKLCIIAPGKEILSARSTESSAYSGETYVELQGTSMAAPMVSGGLALMRSAFPELTAPETLQILFDTAYDAGEVGIDEVYGRGIMQLWKAMSPQGSTVLYAEDTVDGQSYKTSDSYIVSSSVTHQALSRAIAGKDMILGDKYNRGFVLSADSFLHDGENFGKETSSSFQRFMG